ncbi:M23 family metallopeptidase [Paenibacillus prosopidis]|uniref:Peptidase M23-like protein n=1 Tax=Paenibacillus prosopidis TaxID=630520 RepID=A0A368VSK2_9BACL|nr:peptidase M23-like protein [Paenibacillus prosopidis]
MDLSVKEGDNVKAGDIVAKVGNNGYSRHPHIHVGAWKGNIPLQIRFDLKSMGSQLKNLGEEMYYL